MEYRVDLLDSAVVSPTAPAELRLASLPITDYFGAVTPLAPAPHAYTLSDNNAQAVAQPRPSKERRRTVDAARTATEPMPSLPTLRTIPPLWLIAGVVAALLGAFVLDAGFSSKPRVHISHSKRND